MNNFYINGNTAFHLEIEKNKALSYISTIFYCFKQ